MLRDERPRMERPHLRRAGGELQPRRGLDGGAHVRRVGRREPIAQPRRTVAPHAHVTARPADVRAVAHERDHRAQSRIVGHDRRVRRAEPRQPRGGEHGVQRRALDPEAVAVRVAPRELVADGAQRDPAGTVHLERIATPPPPWSGAAAATVPTDALPSPERCSSAGVPTAPPASTMRRAFTVKLAAAPPAPRTRRPHSPRAVRGAGLDAHDVRVGDQPRPRGERALQVDGLRTAPRAVATARAAEAGAHAPLRVHARRAGAPPEPARAVEQQPVLHRVRVVGHHGRVRLPLDALEQRRHARPATGPPVPCRCVHSSST